MRVDAHHHLWQYTPEEYGWIDDSMRVLRRNFLPEDITREAQSAGVDAVITVQARQTLEETQWLLALADNNPIMQGVVGWAPIAAPEFPKVLRKLVTHRRLKGLRHVVQAEPDGFLDHPDFNRGIAQLEATGLVYDILIFARQLEEAARFVDRHPNQTFVLDHIAKPDIAHDGLGYWAPRFRELAKRPNVSCKISGMVTEADWATWTPDTLKPYFDIALESFTPERLMIGTDWPVCTVACSYSQWWQTVSAWLAPLSRPERAALEGETAARVYNLEVR